MVIIAWYPLRCWAIVLFVADQLRHIVIEVGEPEIGIVDTGEFLYMVAYPRHTWHIDERKLEIAQRDIVIGDIEANADFGQYLIL